MARDLILALDQGTTSTRAILFDRAGRRDCLVKAAAFAHDVLRFLGIIPEALILDARVELVEPAQRLIPVEEAAQQRERVVDRVDMGLRFGAHGKLQNLGNKAPVQAD